MTPKLLSTLPATTLASLRADVFAGITVAMVALPLSLAIAIASGADPSTGLVTAIVAGFLISAFGGSRVQIGGPTGAFIVVVYDVIVRHGFDGLLIATFMAGIILIIAATLRAGTLIRHIPEAVINGFTIGIAVIIASSQIKDGLGLTMDHLPADMIEKIPALWEARETLSLAAVGVTLVTMVLIYTLRRAAPRWPGLIVAVAATSVAVPLFNLPVDTIADRFGTLSASLPAPQLPDMDVARLRELFPSALIIAFLAGIESLLSAIVADRMIDDRHKPNAELLAQGIANLASPLFGGLPATGAIARTATNVRAGGRTPLAGMIHALVILVVMWVAAPLASGLAMPALAGLLILTAWNMAEPHKWGECMRDDRSNVALLLITLGLTVLTDLTIAIGTGVTLGLALRLRRNANPPDWTPRDK
ncbi:SulP family inorganic anion transporter [Marivivens sp.]|jgi:sulfate permease, SulP family|uniref:SulP family inorganic anion transporter n=1 Tax=Marivivens sp. TaxID=1978374 RepID=UPI00201F2EB5|nr:SulP family inorganic anion transporter [Marivivens sp.]MCL7404627.1 SulP family inorganic anion transporter [Marivivens geojensis]NBT52128.1 SulP family inorganic anion transporter [Marivivens sp.]